MKKIPGMSGSLDQISQIILGRGKEPIDFSECTFEELVAHNLDDDLPMLEDLFCRLYQVEQPAESKNEEPEPF